MGYKVCSEKELDAAGKLFSKDTRDTIDAAGAAHGCHTCGSNHPKGMEEQEKLEKKYGKDTPQYKAKLAEAQGNAHFVPDHVPPAGMHSKRGKRGVTVPKSDINDGDVLLLPHCRKCSSKQGGSQSGLLGKLSSSDTKSLGRTIMDLNQNAT